MLGLAACALILASCSQNEVFENRSESNAIAFSNLNDRVTTRLANDSSSNYGVYAVRSGNANTWFMNNINVDGTANTYTPVSYWPGGNNVTFYAYAPHAPQGSGNIAITSTTVPNLPVTYTVPANADEDFTVATPVQNVTDTGNPVTLNFNHMLSKITITADLTQTLKDAGYTIDFTGATATVSVAQNSGTTNLTTAAALLTPGVSPATYSGAKSYMFIPQDAIGTTIQLINVTIQHNNEGYWNGDMKAYSIVAGNVSPDDKFKPNTHYSVAFTIAPDANDDSDAPVFGAAITFTADIAPWDTSSVGINQP